jgi:ABC-type polysaccharide/polyol phosphate transport system ATPase subunit
MARMTAPAIVVDRVSKRFRRPHEQMHTIKERALHPFRRRTFDEFEAVRDVEFAVEQGEFFGIVGRNGSGKSTLLKLIAGIYKVNGGEIWVNGRMSTFIELGVGFNPDLAARDNVILNGIMLGLTPAEARARYEEVIDFAELREFENLKLKNYSSGMHVRLAFSVMIQVDADILLIDEVLAVGDASFQQKCFDEFNRLREEGKTIILVTHDMGAVRRFADRAMLMERGRVVSVDEPELVGAQYLELNFMRDQRRFDDSRRVVERFGDGRARVREMWVEDFHGRRLSAVPQQQEVTIRATVEFHDTLADPAVGLVVENEDHRPVFAVNSAWNQERSGAFAKGDTATLSVRFRNVLAPGRYYLSPTVSSGGGGLEMADYAPRLGSFVVSGTMISGGMVDLTNDVTLTPGSAAPPLAETAETAS